MDRFGPYLAQALEKANLSQSQFAKLVDFRQQHVSEIIAGKRLPPLKHLSAWAKALHKHIDPEAFLELGELEHCPPRIRALVAKLRAELR